MRDNMYYFRILEHSGNRIAALCDEELIGTIITDGKITIDLKKYAGFYKGEKVTEEDKIVKELKSCNSINLVGKRSVGLAIKNRIIEEQNLIIVNGIPHAQAYWI